jgi:hypothetical protein
VDGFLRFGGGNPVPGEAPLSEDAKNHFDPESRIKSAGAVLVNTESSGSDGRALDVWEERIGVEAAATLRRAGRCRRIMWGCAVAFALFEIAFQLAKNSLGVGLSALWLLAAIFFGVCGVRIIIATTRQAGRYLGLSESERKHIPPMVRPDVFDMWLAGRGKPGWPRKAPRRY